MTGGAYLWLIGWLLILTPSVLFLVEGGRDDADMASWLVRQPLERIMRLSKMQLFGVLLVHLGAIP